ncbi:hypothetical protein MNBD_GAMMA15-183 [hydrothermal vent metagenome]|uniref:Uncharacterized protein n=1 Tax=hydrothermal vent metagenome TaxID=652676 RepID=A0A3B0YMA6_9ZZZZ
MMRRVICSVGVLMLLLVAPLPADEPAEVALVLVSGSDLGGSHLTPNQLRRVFLGIPVKVGGQNIRALRYTGDSQLNEIFLQKVVYMTERRYERQLVSQTFRTGQMRPPNFDKRGALVQALKSVPYNVSVLWKHDAEKDPDLYVIQEIWKGRQ